MNDTPTPKPEEIASLLRLGLDDDADSAAQTLDATMRVDAPSPPTGANARRRGWEPPSVEVLQQMLPQYAVTHFIARGGMGAVYKGTQKALKRPVAIKVLPPEIEDGDLQFSERFKHEAQAMARLTHPNIVAVFDAGETPDGLLYFVMEFIEGTDVAQLIASEGPLESQHAINITVAVCEALAFAHEEGIVHRDIKPSNIMIDKRGRVKVADFGLAKSVHVEATLLTGTNMAVGTPDFIAPESLIPGIKIDQRADIYAVGVMLYQMLTGRVPRGRFESPSAVTPLVGKGFDAIVDKAMQTDRDRRYSTAMEMKTDVEKVLSTSVPPPSPRSGTGPVPVPKAKGLGKSRSLSKPLLIGGVAVAAVIAGTLFALKKPAVPDDVSSLSSTSGAKVEEEKWERIWNEGHKGKDGSMVVGEDGWIEYKTEGPYGGTLLSPRQWRDSAIRCEWRWAEGSAKSNISIRQWEASRYTLSYTRTSIRLKYVKPAGDEKVLQEYPINEPKIGDIFTLELRAVGTTLTAKLNGKEIIRVEDTELAAGSPAIYFYGAAGFRNIEVLNLDGVEASPPSRNTPWVRMWNEPREFHDRSAVVVEDGWLVCNVAPPGGGILVYPKQWRDSAIRSEWRWAEGSLNSNISVRQWEAVRYTLWRTKNSICLAYKKGSEKAKVLKEYLINEPKIGDIFTLELWAVGTTITAKLDGKEIIRVEDTQLAAGGPALYLYGAAGMRNIEVLNLDLAEAKAPIPPSRSLPGSPSPAAVAPAAQID